MNRWSADWTNIAQRFEENSLGVFVLPLRGAVALLSVSERLKWASSWRDVSSSEMASVIETIEMTENGLAQYVTLDDVHQQLVRIADALEGLDGGGGQIEGIVEAGFDALVAGVSPELALILRALDGTMLEVDGAELSAIEPPQEV